jgi:hypothetical protein
MIDEHTIELINTGIDGELAESRKAELDTILENSDEARQLHSELTEFSGILENEEPLDLPDGLHRKIVESISLPAASRNFSFTAIPGFIRYGLAAAAGLVLTVGIYESQQGGPGSIDMNADVGSMVGTIMRNDKVEVEETLDTFIFDIEQLSSTIRLQRRDGALALDVLLDSKDPVDITVDFTSDGLQFDAIAQAQGELQSIEFADQAIQVKGQGQHHFAVLLHRDSDLAVSGGAKIELRFASNGEIVKEGTLVIK